MALLSLMEVRGLFETDLSDAALQTLLDAAAAEIVQHAGPHASASALFRESLSRVLVLQRAAASITSVHERVDDIETALAAADYRLVADRELVRQWTGPNPRTYWGDEVRVAYVPASDLPVRRRAQADLVKLAAQYQGLKSETAGDLAQVHPEYQAERDRILSGICRGLGLA